VWARDEFDEFNGSAIARVVLVAFSGTWARVALADTLALVARVTLEALSLFTAKAVALEDSFFLAARVALV